ncbi:MAG: hypothetical protein UX71_C0002G0051 [Parcubacteria group bacterium GW2011_GWA1_47_10]|nr:MAG: hypothetical protein UX71_C0002G0051 [Parcubacteria group bacterium GW2011_GWA1_47_10]OHB07303.1 MAG: hypothetical protein A3A31_02145 [Candidatus Zambryskibacteria bacterium RIFCSPLOWO2_01_FULL_48_25]
MPKPESKVGEDELKSWAIAVSELNVSASSAYMKELVEEGEKYLACLRKEAGSDDLRVKSIEARLAKAEEILRQRLLIESRQSQV